MYPFIKVKIIIIIKITSHCFLRLSLGFHKGSVYYEPLSPPSLFHRHIFGVQKGYCLKPQSHDFVTLPKCVHLKVSHVEILRKTVKAGLNV